MSIAAEYTRIKNATQDIKTSLINLGVEVPSNTKINDIPSLMDDIKIDKALPYGGKNPVLVNEYNETISFDDTDYSSITPSGITQTIFPKKTFFTANLDTENYDYVLIARTLIRAMYPGVPSSYAYIKNGGLEYIYNIGNHYDRTLNNKNNTAESIFQDRVATYHKADTYETGFVSNYSNGIYYYTPPTLSLSSSTSTNPTLTVYSPTINIMSHSTYMSLEAFDYLNTSYSKIVFDYKLYRVDKETAPKIKGKSELVDMVINGSMS